MERKSILVVDDEVDVVRVLRKQLMASGYEVLVAYDGLQAVEEVKKCPDLILLDITMNGMDGIEVLRRVRDAVETKEIPVIMVTAKGASSSILDAQNLGATDYIIKPFEFKELLPLIKKYIIQNGVRS